MDSQGNKILRRKEVDNFISMLPVLLSGFILGFAGSLHCVGMCGPLSLALPTYHLSARLRMLSLGLYQMGRVITYSFFGLIFGIAGRGIYTAGLQQWLSITLGIFILVLAIIYFSGRHSVRLSHWSNFYASLSKLIGKIITSNTGVTGFLLLGMVNGLLPCGMVYIALSATLSFNKVYQAVGFMAMFGTGTLPAMMLVTGGVQMIHPSLRRGFKKSIPYFIAATGIVLILRGLDLGIPFISPHLPGATSRVIECHG